MVSQHVIIVGNEALAWVRSGKMALAPTALFLLGGVRLRDVIRRFPFVIGVYVLYFELGPIFDLVERIVLLGAAALHA